MTALARPLTLESTMREVLKSVATRILATVGAYPTKMTGKGDVQNLIRRLHPVLPVVPLVRLGPNSDGGYLVPDDLDGIEACFSPGVSAVSGFEKDCADLGMRVFLADGSIEKPSTTHEFFSFVRRHVGATTSAEFMTMDEWVHESMTSVTAEIILQMDIEGCEYETILTMSPALLSRTRILVAEFHYLDLLWSEPFFKLASKAFEKLLETHACVHIHPNNCCELVRLKGVDIPPTAEFTFLRSDRVGDSSHAASFPHPLDVDNTARPHRSLPACWFEMTSE